MKRLIPWILILGAIVPGMARAQRIALDLDTKDLAAKATETIEVTLDGQLLRLAARFLASDDDRDAAALAEMVRKLEGIYVRSYTFAEEGAYERAWIARFRTRIGPGWQRLVQVRSGDSENIEIYTSVKDDIIQGLIVIAAEPKELTFVNIVGPIDLDDFGRLEGQFGIPRVSDKARED